jgi:hypothetical protein
MSLYQKRHQHLTPDTDVRRVVRRYVAANERDALLASAPTDGAS